MNKNVRKWIKVDEQCSLNIYMLLNASLVFFLLFDSSRSAIAWYKLSKKRKPPKLNCKNCCTPNRHVMSVYFPENKSAWLFCEKKRSEQSHTENYKKIYSVLLKYFALGRRLSLQFVLIMISLMSFSGMPHKTNIQL